MKKTFIIGLVWTSVIICLVSFGATVFYLEADARKNKKELVGQQENENISLTYETNQTAIRTNQLANLEEEEHITTKINQSSNMKNEENDKEHEKAENEKNEKNYKSTENRENDEIDSINTIESMNPNIIPFLRPVKGEILRPFSDSELIYSNTLQEWSVHKGTDYKAQIGEEVYAVRSGTVKEISNNEYYGEFIILSHEDNLESLYANITALDALKIGETVQQGQLIGYVAESYGFEVGEETHLHFELKNGAEYLAIE